VVTNGTSELYRPMRVADWPAISRPILTSRLVAADCRFLEEYRWEPPDERLRLLDDKPSSTGDERWDVLLAGIAEYLAGKSQVGGPAWAEDLSLRVKWFPFSSPSARVDAFVHAPRRCGDVECLCLIENWRSHDGSARLATCLTA